MDKNTISYWRERSITKKGRFEQRYGEIPLEANALLTMHDLMQEADSYIQAGFSVWGTLIEFFPKYFNGLYHLNPEEDKLISMASHLEDPKESGLDLSRHELVIHELDLVETVKSNRKYARRAGDFEDTFLPLKGKHEVRKQTGYPQNPDCVIGSMRVYLPEERIKDVDFDRIARRPGFRLHQGYMLKELYRANKQLKDVNEYMIDAGRRISHDGRSKAFCMTGDFKRALKRIPEEMPEVREMIGLAIKNIQGLEEILTTEAKKLSQMGAYGIIKEDVDLHKMLEYALGFFGPEIESHGLRVVKNIEVEIAPASVNPDQLKSAMRNLLDNAIKRSDGEIEVYLGKDKEDYVFSVKNTGKGISEDRIKTIFQNGVIGEDSEGGLGLGLGIVEKAAKAHGGRVEAESDGKSYSKFILRLPKS